MILRGTGPVINGFFVTGNAQFPVYLMDGPQPVLFDGGVTAAGILYEHDIRSILGVREPALLFLTHAHWDHCGAVGRLKSAFPALKIAASEESSVILSKTTVQRHIADLNQKAISVIASTPSVDTSHVAYEPFQPFMPDMFVRDGQSIRIEGEETIEVIATPGHTRDFISYYLPVKKVLISSEASGCLNSDGSIFVEFLADFDDYLASLKRIAGLQVDVLCQGHRLVFVGRDEVCSFFARSILETEKFKDKVYRLFEEEDSIDSVISRIKAEDYDVIEGVKQPEIPYLINLRAQVVHLGRKRKR
ncbi:MAG: beta-lactamase domain protein [Acidobacteria bacterium]|nr:beta-lactamase domain protein [Acidobacteriota bacterium]